MIKSVIIVGKIVIHALDRPFRWVARGLFKIIPHNKSHSKIVMGVVVIFTGSFMATNPAEWLPHSLHFIWDGIAYSLHGFGLSPILKARGLE